MITNYIFGINRPISSVYVKNNSLKLNKITPSLISNLRSMRPPVRSNLSLNAIQEGKLYSNKCFKEDSKDLGFSDSWQEKSMQQFSERMLDESFPCPFSKLTYKKNEQSILFINGFESEHLEILKSSLINHIDSLEKSERKFNPLLVAFKPVNGLNLLEYHDLGWKVLQYLHENDDFEWPKNTPSNPDDHLWSFCFHGIQLFINISTPAQMERKARNLGDSMMLVINPRESFDSVAGNNKHGLQTRSIIRKNLAAYEGKNKAPHDVGSYGDKSNHEWKQYVTYESSAPAPKKCPLSIFQKKESNK